MAKTKTSVKKVPRAIAAAKAPARPTIHAESMNGTHCCSCDHGVDVSRCWMCWLFKTLIALFVAFLVLWAGFYMGILSMSRQSYRIDPALERLLNERRSLRDSAAMSRTMNTASMEKMMTDMTAALKDKVGADFDREFLAQMTLHHEGAVEMARLAVDKSVDPEIKAFAQKIIDAQSSEISQMKAWQNK